MWLYLPDGFIDYFPIGKYPDYGSLRMLYSLIWHWSAPIYQVRDPIDWWWDSNGRYHHCYSPPTTNHLDWHLHTLQLQAFAANCFHPTPNTTFRTDDPYFIATCRYISGPSWFSIPTLECWCWALSTCLCMNNDSGRGGFWCCLWGSLLIWLSISEWSNGCIWSYRFIQENYLQNPFKFLLCCDLQFDWNSNCCW